MDVWTPALVAILAWPALSLPLAVAVGRSFDRGREDLLADLERLPVTLERR